MYSDAAATYTGNGAEGDPLCGALERIVDPLARLCLANGMPFARAEELLKRSFIEAVQELQPDLPERGMVSRIAAATGINRREVTRLVRDRAPRRPHRIPLAAEVIARWTALPLYRNDAGEPLVLKRQGDAPSFESLARSITRDVHPRSLLDELVRLGLGQYDAASDCVTLVHTDFIPQRDSAQMFALLGDNVGDHLAAAVANVIGDGDKHLEQAVFADELSAESAAALRTLIASHWQALRDELVPTITDLIEADKQAGRKQDQRVRIGLYSFSKTEAGLRKPPQQGLGMRRLRTTKGAQP